MSEETIVRYCAPTLAGIKPANLFTYIYQSEDELVQSLRSVNNRLRSAGLRMIPLSKVKSGAANRKKCLLLLYRPKKLAGQLSDASCRDILAREGYQCSSLDEDLCRLISRFAGMETFPHEIGLFLGYPAEDVKGFIENNGANYKLCGCWKVYGDEHKARCQFERYRRCTDLYCARIAGGESLDRLIVRDKR